MGTKSSVNNRRSSARNNCGIGDSGFEHGNTCASGGADPFNLPKGTPKEGVQAAGDRIKDALRKKVGGSAALEKYVAEVERQHGPSYWQKFNSIAEVADDFHVSTGANNSRMAPQKRTRPEIRQETIACLIGNAKGKVTTKTIAGEKYYVAPITLIVPGVLSGSQGAGFYSKTENGKNVRAWNGMPLLMGHPKPGEGSGRNSDILNERYLGFVLDVKNGKNLEGRAYFSETALNTIKNGTQLKRMLLNGEPIEVSTGLDLERHKQPGTHNGTDYDWIAKNYQPDHVAVLLDEKGACSTEDGCGINNAEGDDMTENNCGTGAGGFQPGNDCAKGGGGGGSSVKPEEMKVGLKVQTPFGEGEITDVSHRSASVWIPSTKTNETVHFRDLKHPADEGEDEYTPGKRAEGEALDRSGSDYDAVAREANEFGFNGTLKSIERITDAEVLTRMRDTATQYSRDAEAYGQHGTARIMAGVAKKAGQVARRLSRGTRNSANNECEECGEKECNCEAAETDTNNSISNEEETMKLNKKQRAAVVNSIIENGCGCYTESEREVLNTFSDERLQEIVDHFEEHTTNAELVTNGAKGVDFGKVAARRLKNSLSDEEIEAEYKNRQAKKAAQNECAENECDKEESDEEDKMAMMKKAKNEETKNAKTAEEYLAEAPAEIRSVIVRAYNRDKKEREGHIARLVANHETDDAGKAAVEAIYNAMTIEQLETLVNALPKREEPQDDLRDLHNGVSYEGRVPAFNRKADKKAEPKPLGVPTMDQMFAVINGRKTSSFTGDN